MSDTTYHQASHKTDVDRPSSYSFWTWFIAALLAIALLWLWHHDRWPQTACCDGSSAAAPVEAVPVSTAPFSFTAGSTEDFESDGDHDSIGWFSHIPKLEAWLSKGSDWKLSGDAEQVTLKGTVDSEAAKTAAGEEAQDFFGSDVTINNLLTVVEPLPAIEATAEPEVAPIADEPEATKPEDVRVYFGVGFHALPAEAPESLTPIADYAKANPDSKVVVAGFHDPTGNQIMNIELSKNRAKSVYRHLLSVGVPEAQIELRKPQNVEGDGDYREARRAEVSIE